MSGVLNRIREMRILVNVTMVFCLCLLAFSVKAITPAKQKDINTLLTVMSKSSMAEEMADTMVSVSIARIKEIWPNLEENVEHAVSQAIYDVVMKHAPELVEMLVPLYDKYYTHQEIKDLIVFFETPTGRKYSAVVSPMLQDIAGITQEWSGEIATEAVERAEAELARYGYK